jgi:hypothetical protein
MVKFLFNFIVINDAVVFGIALVVIVGFFKLLVSI